ncbi:solute carrier family 19 [Thecamonas trahens ATCC 50062]|uniref:Solute carrier family 19 n=1 Tax=Thecamonas trahens ATCC 50062 TaxID=461836 RepID=A0A0L0DHD3_THETB|nr:solute carrier family 19 [Thecamonas trahens ATCC 50062]KNC51605.1 solute carrier family 19 [Thecamonas trahens ATCC 50062]|eukprot:XP_013756002.1 solute carrier family 19 [Thecamonas trahens ATCC 50062]
MALAGLLFNCQPSEPYLTAYLKNDKGLTSDTLDASVWPWNTYSAVPWLLLVALMADIAGPWPVLLLGALLRLATRNLLLFASGVPAMAAAQVTYAGASAVNTIYFAYVYIAVPRKHYAAVTGIVHAAWHAGNLVGSAAGQAYVSAHGGVHHAPLAHLFYASLLFTSCGTASLFLLPSPRAALPPSVFSLARGLRTALSAIAALYDHAVVRAWSLWWIAVYGAHYVIGNYYQTQFSDIRPHDDKAYGAVEMIIEAGSTLASGLPLVLAAASLASASTTAALGSLLLSGCYFASTRLTSSVYYSFAFNTAAITAFAGLYAVASNAIGRVHGGSDVDSDAPLVADPHYAVVFALNTLVALGLATIGQATGVHAGYHTNDYYVLAAIVTLAAAVAITGHGIITAMVRSSPPLPATRPLLESAASINI